MKKILSVILAVIMLTSVFTACDIKIDFGYADTDKKNEENTSEENSSDVIASDSKSDTVSDSDITSIDESTSKLPFFPGFGGTDTEKKPETVTETPEDSDTTTAEWTETDSDSASDTTTDSDTYITICPTDRLDFQGRSIGIASRPQNRFIREFMVEAATSPLDIKVYQRNTQVEKELNVKLNIIQCPDMWSETDITNYVTSEYQSGAASEADVVASYAAYGIAPQLRGFYANLNDSDQVPYMDIDSGYWNQSFIRSATCYEQLYYIVGDINLSVYDKSVVTFVNLDLAETVGVLLENLYDAVAECEWTYDYVLEIVQNFNYVDSDADGTVNVGDIVPLATVNGSEAYDPFLRAWDIDLLLTDVDYTHTINIDGNAKLAHGISNLETLYVQGGVFLGSFEDTFDKNFVKGNALFDFDIIYRNEASNIALRNAAFSYAILPLPMLDNDQDAYHATPQESYNLMSVIAYDDYDRLEATSATLELLCAKSYDSIHPFYVQKMVNTTYEEDAKKITMFEWIMDGISFDTETVYNSQLNYMCSNMWRAVIMNGTTVDDQWAKEYDATKVAVEDFDNWFYVMSTM